MSDENEGHTRSFAAGLVLGGLIGAGLALLFAPHSGEETRRMIRRRSRKLADGARDRYDDLKDRVRRARREAGDASAD